MNEHDTSRLTQRLRDLADIHPVEVPELVPMARTARTRRRLVAAGATLAVAALAGGSYLSLSRAGTPEAGQPGVPVVTQAPQKQAPEKRAPQKQAPEKAPLTVAEIEQRCAAQLTQYNTNVRFRADADTAFTVARPARSYAEGDVVAFAGKNAAGAHALERFCIVPAQGEQIDVLKALSPTDANTTLMVSYISESQLHFSPAGEGQPRPRRTADSYKTPDLRGATVLASANQHGAGVYVLQKDGVVHVADMNSPAWDIGSSVATWSADWHGFGLAQFATGAGNKSIVDDGGAFHISAGKAPAGTVKVTYSGQINGSFPVDKSGWYAHVGYAPQADNGVEPVVYQAVDAQGKVLLTVDTDPDVPISGEK